jgi:DNA-directed RNA polymerase specialized sigma24 family protein
VPDPYEDALARLPEAHAQLLRLTAAGRPTDEICRELGIEPEGLQALLDLARRKLRRELTRR